ncbi:SpoIIE family protein phosphatase [Streptomyces antimycoticus]|uniref:SpoIIE family protein phosphatase n=1 Tax=Streptomyces TaxID=1883 RepID=UPI00342B5C1C
MTRSATVRALGRSAQRVRVVLSRAVSHQALSRGDRILFFTDGLIGEHRTGEEQFGEERMLEFVDGAGCVGEGVQEMVRGLSHTLMRERGGVTTDDATLFLVEWRGGTADRLVTV